MATTERAGEHFRVADPDWPNPLDGSYSMRFGARWNAASSFPVVYMCGDRRVARAVARDRLDRSLAGFPYSADDIDASSLPVLLPVDVPADRFLDAVSSIGLLEIGLPETYPVEAPGRIVSWDRCQPIGRLAWDNGLRGVACRSAASTAPAEGEELAWFERGDVALTGKTAEPFEQWYGPFDW